MGGAGAVAAYLVLCLGVVFSMKIDNFVQHYGLRRIRLPSGKFERVQPWHVWSVDRKLHNWLFFNMQRRADHHVEPGRRYPLTQHHGADMSPQLPGGYREMSALALFPRRWFATMDPLVEEWRTHFYPQIEDWRAYDSPAFAARPNAFESINEILGASPRLGEWINRAPELLDNLGKKEFTDLNLPDGFGPDPEFEAIARRGLARVYWTHEFRVAQMKEEIADIPVQGIREAVEIARDWSNGKTFQIAVHTMRGNLTPIEAGESAVERCRSLDCRGAVGGRGRLHRTRHQDRGSRRWCWAISPARRWRHAANSTFSSSTTAIRRGIINLCAARSSGRSATCRATTCCSRRFQATGRRSRRARSLTSRIVTRPEGRPRSSST